MSKLEKILRKAMECMDSTFFNSPFDNCLQILLSFHIGLVTFQFQDICHVVSESRYY